MDAAWNTLYVAFGILFLILMVLVGILIVRRGGIGISGNWLHKDNVVRGAYLILPIMLAIIFFWMFGSLFPATAASYYARGGPYWSVLITAGLLGALFALVDKTAYRVGVATPFLLLLFIAALVTLWSPTPEERVQQAAEQAARAVVAQPINTICPSLKRPMRYEKQRPATPINPGGQCSLDYWQDGTGLMATQAGKDRPLGPFYPGQAMPKDIEYVWSAGKAFDGFIQLNPPRYN